MTSDLTMREPLDGFRVGEHFLPWGTTAAEAPAILRSGFKDAPNRGYRRFGVPCTAAFGLETTVAELSAPGAGRPVTRVQYSLVLPPGTPPAVPEPWLGPLARTLGLPSTTSVRPMTAGVDAASIVRFFAVWDIPPCSVRFSLYGAPRHSPTGQTAGALDLTWSSVEAAKPFLAGWHSQAAKLASMALAPSMLRRFALEELQRPLFGGKGEAGDDGGELRRECELVLAAPHILPTPATIAVDLDPQSFALYDIAEGCRWCASTLWDTIVYRAGDPVTVAWNELLPAKGPGSSGIYIEGWAVMDVARSAVIDDAARVLSAIRGVRLTHTRDDDC